MKFNSAFKGLKYVADVCSGCIRNLTHYTDQLECGCQSPAFGLEEGLNWPKNKSGHPFPSSDKEECVKLETRTQICLQDLTRTGTTLPSPPRSLNTQSLVKILKKLSPVYFANTIP